MKKLFYGSIVLAAMFWSTMALSGINLSDRDTMIKSIAMSGLASDSLFCDAEYYVHVDPEKRKEFILSYGHVWDQQFRDDTMTQSKILINVSMKSKRHNEIVCGYGHLVNLRINGKVR